MLSTCLGIQETNDAKEATDCLSASQSNFVMARVGPAWALSLCLMCKAKEFSRCDTTDRFKNNRKRQAVGIYTF